MRNAIHGKALASAVVISVAIQGSMLWQFNQAATQGVSSQATVAEVVTLPTVHILGQREAASTPASPALAITQSAPAGG